MSADKLCRISPDLYFPVERALYALGYIRGPLDELPDKIVIEDRSLENTGIYESPQGKSVLEKAAEYDFEDNGGSKFYVPPQMIAGEVDVPVPPKRFPVLVFSGPED